MRRRKMLTMLAIGVVLALSGCSSSQVTPGTEPTHKQQEQLSAPDAGTADAQSGWEMELAERHAVPDADTSNPENGEEAELDARVAALLATMHDLTPREITIERLNETGQYTGGLGESTFTISLPEEWELSYTVFVCPMESEHSEKIGELFPPRKMSTEDPAEAIEALMASQDRLLPLQYTQSTRAGAYDLVLYVRGNEPVVPSDHLAIAWNYVYAYYFTHDGFIYGAQFPSPVAESAALCRAYEEILATIVFE